MVKEKKAIVISAGPLGLGIIRSLGYEGIKSIVIYSSEYEIGAYSKYCVERHKIDDYLDKKRIFELLMENRERWGGLLIIPGNDEALIALSYYREKLGKYYVLNVPGADTVKKIVNKEEMLKLANKAKIPYPKVFFPKTMHDIGKLENVNYPCLIKPLERHYFYAIFKTKMFTAESYKELKEKFSMCLKNDLDVSVTELIPGPDSNLVCYEFYVAKNGEITNEFVKVKVRQTPPYFGVSRVCKSCDNKDVGQLAKKFMSQMKDFRGPGQIEFKYDERDGKYKFIELNGRIILTVSLSTRCGINYPFILYKEYVDSELIKKENYEKNVYWISIYNDLVTTFFKNDGEHTGILDFMAPYFRKKVFSVASFSDMMPMLALIKVNLADKLFKKFIKI